MVSTRSGTCTEPKGSRSVSRDEIVQKSRTNPDDHVQQDTSAPAQSPRPRKKTRATASRVKRKGKVAVEKDGSVGDGTPEDGDAEIEGSENSAQRPLPQDDDAAAVEAEPLPSDVHPDTEVKRVSNDAEEERADCDGEKPHTTNVESPSAEAEKSAPPNAYNENKTSSSVDQSTLTEKHLALFTENNASAFLKRDTNTNRACRQVILDSHREQSVTEFGDGVSNQTIVPKKRGDGLPPLGPVLVLDVGPHFDSDQLWEEIELRNKPLLSHIQRRLRHIQKSQNERAEQKDTGLFDKQRELPEIQPALPETNENGHMETALPSDDSGSGEDEDEDATSSPLDREPDPSSSKQQTSTKRRVTFAPDVARDTTNDEDKDRPTSKDDAIAEDGFFSVKDMEMFADEAEGLAIAGKLMESEDDEESDDAADPPSPKASKALDTAERLEYDDFFDPPSNVNGGFAEGKGTDASRLLSSIDGDLLSEDDTIQTPLTAKRARTRQMIDAIEDENVSKKPWQLRGEVSGHSRPKDSLLDMDMDHDSSMRFAPLSGTEKDETIEDVIRQRITDGLFDDVVRTFSASLDTAREQKRDDLPELSQAKPSEGLADVYARDFMLAKESARSNATSQEISKETEQESPEQQEVSRLYEKLAGKLDALAGIQFMPSPRQTPDDMKVQGNVMALKSEEAIPEGVSDAKVLTPRETYSVEGKALTGQREVTKKERRANRSKAKRGRKSANAAKERAAQLMQQSHPQRAEKRRAEESLLRRGKKIRFADPQPSAGQAAAAHFAPGSKIRNILEQGGGREKLRPASSLLL